MNQTEAPAAALPDATGVITGAHLTLIIVLAIAAMLVIWWGGRRRARERAEREAHDVPIANERTVQPTPIEPPVTPAPPPLADDLPIIPPEPAPAVQPLPAESAPATGDSGQPVTLLKGLGPKVASRLAELGITTVGQLAALSPGEADALDGELGTFSGRMTRDRWIEQAQLLAAGDRAGYEATFGKLG